MLYSNPSPLGPTSNLIQFFEEFHDSSYDYYEEPRLKFNESPFHQFIKGEKPQILTPKPRLPYVASSWQRDTFRVIGIDRAAMLTNDFNLIYRKYWVRLITSLDNKDIQAEVVIEMRYESFRKKLLKGMEADTRNKILEKISQIQTEGYTTLNRDSWYSVATPTFNSVCGVYKKHYVLKARQEAWRVFPNRISSHHTLDKQSINRPFHHYEEGDTIINKTYRVYISYTKCA
jgi:hypothetical protein